MPNPSYDEIKKYAETIEPKKEKKAEPPPKKEPPKEGFGDIFMKALFGKKTPEQDALGAAPQGGSETDPDEIIRKQTKLRKSLATP